MKAFNLMFGYICLNLAAFFLAMSGAFPVAQQLYVSPTDVTNTFTLTMFVAAGVTGGVMSIIALITRQYVFAASALLIVVIGILLPIVQWVILGLPFVLTALLAPVPELSWLSGIVGAFFAVSLFMFMAELAAGRQVT